MFAIAVTIDDSWISPVYDHVHHGTCLSLFEHARLALVESIGFPNDRLLKEGKVLVITRVDMSYKREVKRGKVSVTCDHIEYQGRTIRIHQRVLNERGKVAVEGVVELMFMDHATRRGMDAPSTFVEALLKQQL